MVSMEDGYRLIKHRAAAMQACAEQNPGSMCAVMGVDTKEIEEVCEKANGYVVPTNYNSPVQTVIAEKKRPWKTRWQSLGKWGRNV